jgi:LmbE family N-acetylglucosaminyl deacetylase
MTEKENNADSWDSPQTILVILAHPDDPEFFCGATISRWSKAGHQISYCLLTCGDKGTNDRNISKDNLCSIRYQEQRAAARKLGVTTVTFLGYPDGYLVPSIELRKEVTREIRKVRPSILVTCDPTNLYFSGTRINHPDHRAAGQVVLDAVFPASQNHLYFEDLLTKEGLEPHAIREVWITLPTEHNIVLDVTSEWESKINALYEHKSQIGDTEKFTQRMRDRRTADSTPEKPRYEERFRRLVIN